MSPKAKKPQVKYAAAKAVAKRASLLNQGRNSTSKAASRLETPSKPPKSPTATPAQPIELSEKHRALLREWLDHTDRPFTVHTVPLSRKRKRNAANQLQVQDNLFEERLAVQYEVKPRDKWESLKRYKKFTVGDESIATGECILVNHDESVGPKMDSSAQWKAKVLEVRALDPEHVYIRLSWLNRPEDLDSGRKDYHGKNELVPTNQMDVIDAMAVNGALRVKHWDEMADGDEESMPEADEYFWRQTFDFANTKTFSSLRKICVDDAPQNPDELIVQCPNGECGKWMHIRCIAEKALQRALNDQAAPKRSSKAQKRKLKLKNPANNPNLAAVAVASKGLVKAKVFLKGYPDIPKTEQSERFQKCRPRVEAADEDEIVITTEAGEQYSEEVCCLFCGTEVD